MTRQNSADAINDIAIRNALVSLSPIIIDLPETEYKSDLSVVLDGDAEGVLTEQWLKDRSEFILLLKVSGAEVINQNLFVDRSSGITAGRRNLASIGGKQFSEHNNYIFGAEEDETDISGAENNDHLFGNGGNDILYGKAGNDYIEGGVGDDTLHSGSGVDVLVGGKGDDKYYLNSSHKCMTG